MSIVNSVMKIDITDRKDVFIVCSYDEHQKHLRIILLDENELKAFSGYATDIDLRSQAATLHMIFTDFMSLTLKALTKNKSDDDKFLYCMEKNCEGCIFKWKSVDEEETIINIGSIKVTENDYKSTTKDAFFLLSEELTTLKEKLAVMNENLCDFKKEMKTSIKLLTDMNDMKERVENELYSKFILVLNEKKKEIRDLKRKTYDMSQNSITYKKADTDRSMKMHQVSDSSDEDGDLEAMDIDIAGPSTSKPNNSLLFFDDDEPPLLPSPSKKRNRNQRTVAKNRGCEGNNSKVRSVVVMESESEDELLNKL